MASASLSAATASGDLAELAVPRQGVTTHPSDDHVLAVLQARFRQDQPYTAIGTQNLVVVNPNKALSSSNDASAREYEDRAYRDTQLPLAGTPALQPHPFELAAKMYLLLRRRNESQAVVFRSVARARPRLAAYATLPRC
jgi:chitin synthase